MSIFGDAAGAALGGLFGYGHLPDEARERISAQQRTHRSYFEYQQELAKRQQNAAQQDQRWKEDAIEGEYTVVETPKLLESDCGGS